MADWQEQLNSVLSDPEAMARIASLAQSLSGASAEAAPPPPPPGNAPKPDAGAAASPLSGIDPELLGRVLPLLRQLNRPESGEAAAFLRALQPFLSEKRRGKVERAAQLARLIHLGKTFLTEHGEGAFHV